MALPGFKNEAIKPLFLWGFSANAIGFAAPLPAMSPKITQSSGKEFRGRNTRKVSRVVRLPLTSRGVKYGEYCEWQ